MTLLIDIALRASVPVLVALAACVLLRRRSAALRHRLLTISLAAAAVVIPLSITLPQWEVTVPQTSALVVSESSVEAGAGTVTLPDVTTTSSTPLDVAELFFFVWMAGVAIGMGRLLLGLLRLTRLVKDSETVESGHWHRLAGEIAAQYAVRQPIVLLRTQASDLLATWGLFKARVLLPVHAREWDERRAHAALCHELAHIRRGDWSVQLAADLLRTVFWFNPFFWMLSTRLRHEGEQACDDVVLGTGLSPETYASHLVDIVKACRSQGSAWVPVMPVARPSMLERRITAMLNTRINRQLPTRRTSVLAVVAFLGIAVSMASFELTAQDAGPRTLKGYVYDTSGSVLPAVDVTLVNDQQARWPTTTDSKGLFEFTPVGPGEYELEAKLPGFRSMKNAFTLKTARDWDRSVTMQVGEIEETIKVVAKRPAQVVAAASAGGPVKIGGNIKAPRKLGDQRAVYPPAMREAGMEGVVPMEALIAVDGSVASVRVLSAQVHPEFARAAEDAVRQWRFSPTLLNGAPVEVRMTVSMAFTLED